MAEPEHVSWSDAQQAFHVGDACQHPALPPLDTLVNPPETPPAPLRSDPALRVPTGRPLYGVDEDGNPRPAPDAAPAPEPAAAPARTTSTRTASTTSSTSSG